MVRDGFRCVYCGATKEDSPLEIDHVIPVSRGGTSDIGNLVAACKPCNRGKRAKSLVDVEAADIGIYVSSSTEPARNFIPREAVESQEACASMESEWLEALMAYWPHVDASPSPQRVGFGGELTFRPDFVCRGRSGCDIGDEVRVLVIPWFDVGEADARTEQEIRNAVVSGYDVPTMVLMGPPAFFFGVLVNERWKGTPRGRIIDSLLQPLWDWENTGWYPDEDLTFQDLREPVKSRDLCPMSWDFESERLFGVYSSFFNSEVQHGF